MPASPVLRVVNVVREATKHLVNILRGVEDIDPVTAHGMITREGALVLDVREQHEYAAGHLARSVLIPLPQLERRIGELDAFRHRTIVVLCHGGKRSATACWLLGKLGFLHTYNVAGGILAWRDAQLPVEE